MTQKEIKEKLDNIEDIKALEDEVNKLINEGYDEKIFKKYLNKISKVTKKYDDQLIRKQIEEEYLKTYDIVLGIDEVGRGPLAGPVCAACTMMKKESLILDIDDSKKIKEEVREELFDKIKDDALTYGIALVDAETIDERNILDATFLAMSKAYKEAISKIDDIENKKVLVLIDGNLKNPYIDCEQVTIVKGDAKCYSIASSSILAKVTRDRIMNELDSKYPMYGFIDNKGYGTKKHTDAIKEHGYIKGLHRMTFIKNLI